MNKLESKAFFRLDHSPYAQMDLEQLEVSSLYVIIVVINE